jgi:hypothetical protein
VRRLSTGAQLTKLPHNENKIRVSADVID